MIRPRSQFRSALVVFACFLLVAAFAPAAAGQTEEASSGGLPPGGTRIGTSYPRLDGDLAAIAEGRPAGPVAEERVVGGRISIEVFPVEGRAAEVVAALGVAGGTEVIRIGDMVSVKLPLPAVAALGNNPNVGFAQVATRPFAEAITGEGIAFMGADDWHAAGFTGAGVDVAVIDLGFAGYTGLLGTELPASVQAVNYCDAGFEARTDHGTGVAEIVHEVAPGAALHLVCIDDLADLSQAVTYASGAGVTVINHSVGWFNAGRGDGTGLLQPIVQAARTAGILWVNSGGNYAENHWSGTFVDTAASGYHEFSGLDETDTVTLGTGETIDVFLRWDDWPVSSLDYDVYLFDDTLITPVAWSENEQSGTQPPVEGFSYTNAGAEATFHVAIYKFSGPATTPQMNMFVLGPDPEYRNSDGSLAEPAASAIVTATGGVNVANGLVEYYSSRGPTIDGRIKPDISAPTRISGATYGAGGFGGTSAAAPNAAGFAALLEERHPGITAVQLAAMLENVVTDAGIAGSDNDYGEGVLKDVLLPETGNNCIVDGVAGTGDLLQAVIDASLSGMTVNVTGLCVGQFTIDRDLTLSGSNSATLHGAGGGTTLSVSAGTVTLDGLLITGGDDAGGDGGGIHNVGVLTVSDSTVIGNSASRGGGILNSGTLDLVRSTVAENQATDSHGGGIANLGVSVLNLIDSYIGLNTSGDHGGGVFSQGYLTVVRSIIVGNTAAQEGGGVAAGNTILVQDSRIVANHGRHGGGIFTAAGNTTIESSLVAQNTADLNGGGLRLGFIANVQLSNSTVSENTSGSSGAGIRVETGASLSVVASTIVMNHSATFGGGLSLLPNPSPGSITVSGSIIAENTATNHLDCYNGVQSGGYNVLGTADGCDFVAAAGDVAGSVASPVDPLLGPLVDNGGATRTHGLLPGSPAIGRNPSPGDCTLGITTDQRGAPRPSGTNCDSGAFERGADPPVVHGYLRVVTDPALATQIYVDGVPADHWGLTWMKVSARDHTVSFSDVGGFTTPTPQTVTVTTGATTTVTGSYVARGWLRVTTDPPLPGTITVDGVARNDWGMWTDLPVGSYQVCFGEVADYATPSCEAEVLTAGATTTVTGTYASSPGAAGPTGDGFLRVTTNPAVPSQIIVNGVPRDSWGLTWMKLERGIYVVEFTDISGFTTPDPQVVTVTADTTTSVEGTFVANGWLRVLTDPAFPATIRVNEVPRNDWGMWTGLPVGEYEVCFGYVDAYSTPACQTTTLTAGATTTITGTYSAAP